MTRLVRLNEVQYAETEEQVTALTVQGFREEALAAPTEETIPEPNPAPENPEPTDGKKGGK